MSVNASQKLFDYSHPHDALEDLCQEFVCEHSPLAGPCRMVQPADMPEPFRRLLVHNDHMTEVLEKFYGSRLAVQVLDEEHQGDFYRRKITLTPASTGKVVELGVVRLDFRHTTAAVKAEILARQTPLGNILINHHVLRRIELLWFLEFQPCCHLVQSFGQPITRPLYGRLGTIYCKEEPAIELLEIVTGE